MALTGKKEENKEVQKFEYLENGKSVFSKIENNNFLSTFI